MASPESGFHIQHKLHVVAPHHKSFKQLWETKWKKPCEMGVYPFMFGSIQDFQPIVDELIERDFREPYDWDAYAQTFFPKAKELLARAKHAEATDDKAQASELYLRASAVYRIARFPIPRSEKQRYAWEQGKFACLAGLQPSVSEEWISVSDESLGSTDKPDGFPLYCRVPDTATPAQPAPVVIILTGLDGYRTELAVWMQGFADVGVATLVLEIPGTGDAMPDPRKPQQFDDMWPAVFAWIANHTRLDANSKLIWGFSTGGYYAIRLAHKHADELKGVVALGGGCHYMFSKEWLDNVDHLEYPFDLAGALATKFGYKNNVESFKNEAMERFSLLKDGTLDMLKCARLLLVNGTEDEIFPIEDYELCMRHGAPKEVRFVEGRKHMGEPESFMIVLNWIYSLLDVNADPREQLAKLPFKAKY